jgi:hypothetical protein
MSETSEPYGSYVTTLDELNSLDPNEMREGYSDGAPMRSATWNAYNERQHQEFRDTGKAAITALFDKLEGK